MCTSHHCDSDFIFYYLMCGDLDSKEINYYIPRCSTKQCILLDFDYILMGKKTLYFMKIHYILNVLHMILEDVSVFFRKLLISKQYLRMIKLAKFAYTGIHLKEEHFCTRKLIQVRYVPLRNLSLSSVTMSCSIFCLCI